VVQNCDSYLGGGRFYPHDKGQRRLKDVAQNGL
jgi:hypothetical protein